MAFAKWPVFLLLVIVGSHGLSLLQKKNQNSTQVSKSKSESALELKLESRVQRLEWSVTKLSKIDRAQANLISSLASVLVRFTNETGTGTGNADAMVSESNANDLSPEIITRTTSKPQIEETEISVESQDPRKCTGFECKTGERCLPVDWKCDGARDCEDGSEEEEGTCPPMNCNESEIACQAERKCLPARWKCDGESDCSDGSDEDEGICDPTGTSGHKYK